MPPKTKTNQSTKLSSNENNKKSLGIWIFNKKMKRKCYISLSGQVLIGKDAIIQYHLEKDEKNPTKVIRQELIQNITHLIIPPQNPQYLQSWGIPISVCEKYKSRGVLELFPWQIECLIQQHNASLQGKDNLIYSAPTSGGKTFICEMLMLQRLVKKHGLILFIVPFISLVEEKTKYFQEIWSDLSIGIRPFHGEESYRLALTEDIEVAICTFERANILLNQLLENKETQDHLSMVIVDELHMLGDKHRGYLLEIILSKVHFIYQEKVQIIGMSATLPNLQDFATWLNATLFATDFRPVQLSTHIVCNKVIYSPKHTSSLTKISTINDLFQPIRSINSLSDQDWNGLHALIFETILLKRSVIIFCSSKSKCQKYAKLISSSLHELGSTIMMLHKTSSNQESSILDTSSFLSSLPFSYQEILSFYIEYCHEEWMQKRQLLLYDLLQSPTGLCPILRDCIPYGIAYHNATLTIDERKIIENGFRNGIISILFTTSTLSG